MKYIIAILSTILLFILFIFFPHPESIQEVLHAPQPIPTKTVEERILEKMSDEEKVGQLFIFGFDGTTLNPDTKQFLGDHKIGGVLLLGKNITNEKQLRNLTKDIQTTNRIPLFISIDQEGGVVSRLKWSEVLTLPQSEIASTSQAYTVAKERGEILKGLGINMNLAPVVEYTTDKDAFIYERTYRGTKEAVEQKSISSVKGYTDSGIISVIKHYPGHGDTPVDPHTSLPVVNISNDQWAKYVEPFSKVLEQTSVDALMVGHIKYPKIDKYPSTISTEIINNRLIQALGYKGLVISDDMEMDALDSIDSYPNIAKRAFLAGNDILIYSKYASKHPTIQKDIYEYILGEVKSGRMNVDEKVLKILRIKIKYGILNPTELIDQ